VIAYFDTSALIKLVVDEEGSDRAASVWDATDRPVSAALIAVEGRAALAAAHRGRRLTASRYRRARDEYLALLDGIATVNVDADLIDQAGELAEREGLRGYDAVHLAAALRVSVDVICSSDAALCSAAARRGLAVANPVADAP
jgi:predicted nucleic acid-binding protein